MLGDVLAQKLEGASVLDLGRTLHLGMYGFFLDGPVGHVWYRCVHTYLDAEADTADRSRCTAVAFRCFICHTTTMDMLLPITFRHVMVGRQMVFYAA